MAAMEDPSTWVMSSQKLYSLAIFHAFCHVELIKKDIQNSCFVPVFSCNHGDEVGEYTLYQNGGKIHYSFVSLLISP